jgi:hypothetical protein
VQGHEQAVNLMSAEPISPASQPERRQELLQALTTEHFTLQTARAVAVNEGNGRTALYVGALSSTLVALALVAQRSPLGEVFFVVALTVLPAVFFLGLVTFVRILQSSVEDIIYARAINRIRHYYTELDPAKAHYFLLSGRDDVRGALGNMCLRDSWTQFLFTLPSAVALINGLLGGVAVALAVTTAVGAPLPATVLAGMGSGTVILAVHVAYQVRQFTRMKTTVGALFPSPGDAQKESGAARRAPSRLTLTGTRLDGATGGGLRPAELAQLMSRGV